MEEEAKVEEVKTVELEKVEIKSQLDTVFEQMKSAIAEAKKNGTPMDEALKSVQPIADKLGEAVKNEFMPQGMNSDLIGIIKSAVQEVVAGVVPTKEDIVADVVAQLRGLAVTQNVPAQTVVQSQVAPRSLNVAKSLPEEGQKKLSQIEMLARKSTGM